MSRNYPDGCLTLKSENELFSEILHNVGKGTLTLGMSSLPKLLSTGLQPNKKLWKDIRKSNAGHPYMVSYMFDISRHNVHLQCVRDKDHQSLYQLDKLCHPNKGEYLKLSDTGKLEVYNDENKIMRMATDFTGNQLDVEQISVI